MRLIFPDPECNLSACTGPISSKPWLKSCEALYDSRFSGFSDCCKVGNCDHLASQSSVIPPERTSLWTMADRRRAPHSLHYEVLVLPSYHKQVGRHNSLGDASNIIWQTDKQGLERTAEGFTMGELKSQYLHVRQAEALENRPFSLPLDSIR